MTSRARRLARRLLEVFDWRTFAVAGVFAGVLLVGYTLWSAFSAAHEATQAANQRGRAASRRIDLLNSEIQQLQTRIAAGQDERGQLAAAVNALRAQIEQLGARPVAQSAPTTVVVTVRAEPEPSSSSQPRPTMRPSPKPTTHPTPSPSPRPTPSPTCRPLPIVGCRKAHR